MDTKNTIEELLPSKYRLRNILGVNCYEYRATEVISEAGVELVANFTL